mmetsp:Transcript_25529/g.59534  ORF Transcript_25529/g.59534 Transcript_25529/m.59534 type:complete len:209 (-) Transcript_25529:273-899(-)
MPTPSRFAQRICLGARRGQLLTQWCCTRCACHFWSSVGSWRRRRRRRARCCSTWRCRFEVWTRSWQCFRATRDSKKHAHCEHEIDARVVIKRCSEHATFILVIDSRSRAIVGTSALPRDKARVTCKRATDRQRAFATVIFAFSAGTHALSLANPKNPAFQLKPLFPPLLPLACALSPPPFSFLRHGTRSFNVFSISFFYLRHASSELR